MVEVVTSGRKESREAKESRLIELSNGMYSGLRIVTTSSNLFFGICPGGRVLDAPMQVQVFPDERKVVAHSQLYSGMAERLLALYEKETGEPFTLVRAYEE